MQYRQFRFGRKMFFGCLRSGLFVLLLLSWACNRSPEISSGKTTHMVAMRDGTKLATDVYLPEENQGPLPAVLIRTPYGKNAFEQMAGSMHANGYALVVQDMRGRFDSEGEDVLVFHNDGWGKRRDGHDTINWIAKQTWCDGKVATSGASAMGATQNMLAPHAPAALKAQNVAVAFSNQYMQGAYQGGAFRKELVEDWLRANKFSEENLRAVLAHPIYDTLWAELNPEAQAAHVNAPGIFLGGWYDIFLQGTINSFLAIQNNGGPDARGKCRLIMGPWAHGEFDQLVYPPGSDRPPQGANHFSFFDYHVKGINNGESKIKPVHYYVMGDPEQPNAPGNFWRSADTWPPPSRPVKSYFHADNSLQFKAPTLPNGKLSYKYDPRNPVPTIGGQNLNIPKGPMDQRKVESRSDVLLFTSGPIEEPIEVTGRVQAKLYVSSDCPDTDFTVKLSDIYPDGRSMILTDGILRARMRESFESEKLMEPGKIYEITVDLWSTSIIFNQGHRIRVAVSSSNAPRFEPNPNTGESLRTSEEIRVATNTLYISKQHPSHIILPVYSGSDVEE